MNYQELKNAIIEVIRTNGNEEITGEVLQFTLLEMVSSLGKDYQFAGVATPQTTIQERDDKVAWVLGAGTYENFGIPFTVNVDELAFVLYNGSYTVQKLKVGVVVDDTLTRDGQNPVKGGAIYAEFEKLRAAGYIFAGVMTPAGAPPQNLTEKIFYLCKEGGTYTNFGNITVQDGLSVLKWNGSLWSVDLIFGITDSVTENLASLLTSAGAYLAISAEATLRSQGDGALRQDIADEVLARQQQGNTLQHNIDNEVLRAQGAEQQNANDIDALEALVPSGASSQNKLVDEQKMNSSIGTATATYRGAYNLVSDLSLTVEATHADIEAALALKMTELSITPDNNDYAFVQVPTSDETPTQIERVERYKFNGTVWLFEYALNNSGFTAQQWEALNSGITSGLVTKLSDLPTYTELMTLFGGKQDTINDLSDIRSGAAKGETAYQKPVGGIPSVDMSSGVQSSLQKAENAAPQSTTYNKTEVDGMIGGVEEKIPSGASAQNKLVDQQTMNSSIATATATYRGAYNLVSDLSLTVSATEQQIAAALATKMTALSITPDNNDYCYVQIPTSDATPTQIARVDRYKFNGTTWGLEYSLNNSGFTAAQWAALNSGITSGLVAKLSDLPSLSELIALLAGKQNTLTFDSTPTAGSSNPVTSNGIKQAIDAHTVVTDPTPTAGSTNPVQSGGVKTYVDNAIATQDAEIDSRMDQQDAIISTLNGQDVIVVSSVPASGLANKIYRVYGTTSYTDYMFNADALTTPIPIATYSYPGVENTPTKGSQKLVSSDGIFEAVNYKEIITGNIAVKDSEGQENTFLNTSGVEAPSNNYYLSGYYLCVAGTTVGYKLYGAINSVLIISFYDKDKNIMLSDSVVASGTQPTEGTVTVPQNAVYMRWCHNFAWSGTPEVNTSYIKYTPVNSGKIENTFVYTSFGDSISSDEQSVHADGLAYPRTLANLLGAELNRFTTPGIGVAQLKTNVLVSDNSALLNTIMIGINDLQSLTLGDIDDVMNETLQELAEDTTFLGMYRYSLLTLRSRLTNPNSLICCISPCTNFVYDSPTNVEPSGPQHEGYLLLKAMRDNIRDMIMRMGGPNAGYFYVDGREILPWDALYFIATNNTPDSTHPNSMGEAVLAHNIFNRLPDIQLYASRK